MFTAPWVLPALFSLITWGVSVFIPRIVSQKINVLHMSIYQGVFFFIFSLFFLIYYQKIPILPFDLCLLSILIGIIGTLGQYSYNLSIKRGSVAHVSTVSSLYPLITTFLAVLFLNEDISLVQASGIILGICSVLLIARKSEKKKLESAKNNWLLPSLAALFLWGIWAFLPKVILAKDIHPSVILFYEAIGNIIIIMPVIYKVRKGIDFEKRSVCLLGLSTGLSTTAIFAYYYAINNGPVSIIVILTALYPVVAILLARFLLKEKISQTQIFSLFIAMIAVFLLTR